MYYCHEKRAEIGSLSCLIKGRKSIESNACNHTSEYGEMVYNNGCVFVVFRLKSEMSFFFVKCLNSRALLGERYNDLSVFRIVALVDDDIVTVKDPGVNHTISRDAKGKQFSWIIAARGGKGNVSVKVLLGEDGKSRGHLSKDWNALRLGGEVGTQGDGTAFAVFLADEAEFLKAVKIHMNGGRALKSKLCLNVTDAWGISVFIDTVNNAVKNLLLLWFKFSHDNPSF